MNVAHLTANVSRKAGGIWSVVAPLTEALAQNGVDVSVTGLEDEFSETDTADWHGVPHRLFPPSINDTLGFAWEMGPALDETDADLLHSHGIWTFHSWVSLRWGRRNGRPRIVTPHGMLDPWAVRNSAWKKKIVSWLFEHQHLHGAACLHALNREEAEAFRSYGLTNPICIIPNGVDLENLDSTQKEPSWSNHVTADRKRLLFLGRLHPKKGLANLIRAFAMLQSAQRGDWCLVIAGWDQLGHESELRDLIEELDLGSDVLLVGPQFGRSKLETLAYADAFILPSLSEGLPMSVLEAWACDLPVIMTPQCNLPQGFDAKAAIRVDPNATSIHDGLQRLLALSNDDRAAIGRRGRALVEAQFTWSTVASQFRQVYEWLLGDGVTPESIYRQ